jgi:hypothetical protein
LKEDLQLAFNKKIPFVVCDDYERLKYIRSIAPWVNILWRIKSYESDSLIKFNNKFGASIDETIKVIENPGHGLSGISFHVGSNCGNVDSYKNTINTINDYILPIWNNSLNKCEYIDIGGGLSHIEDVISYLFSNYINKIDKLIITTNGTVLPKQSTLDLLKNSDIILSISDYSDKLENIKSKVLKVINIFKSENINHYVRNEIEWYDFGDLRVSKNLPTDKLIKHFDSCTAPFRGLNDGKFYYCHLNTSAVLTKLFPLNNNDYVSIESVSKENLIKFDLGYTDLGYITFCNNCNGCNTGIKIPVSYEKQGLREL